MVNCIGLLRKGNKVRNIEILSKIMEIVDRELDGHPLPLPELVEIRKLILTERPELTHYEQVLANTRKDI